MPVSLQAVTKSCCGHTGSYAALLTHLPVPSLADSLLSPPNHPLQQSIFG